MTQNPPTIKSAIKKELIRREQARRSIINFTKYTMPDYEDTKAHTEYARVLDLFARGKIKKLIVSMGPQHGKSELSTRRLPSFLLGRNPNLRIAVASYASTLAQSFNRDMQRIIDDQNYYNLFPETILGESNAVTISKSFLRNSNVFEIVDKRGALRAIGRGGGLSGHPVDIMILDDLYKDHSEGNSPVIRESVIDWYTSVVRTRLHNDSQELIVFTRWHEDDLVGFLEKTESVIELKKRSQLKKIDKDSWYKINFPSLSNAESIKNEFDYRKKIDIPLWPSRHGKKKLLKDKALDSEKFESLHQGDPMPRVGLLYNGFGMYIAQPDIIHHGCYIDAADKGTDFLCAIDFGVGIDDLIYVYDVYYTQEPQTVTEQELADFLNRNKRGNVGTEVYVETQAGGESFSRNIDRLSGYKHIFCPFHQGDNKEARVRSNSAELQRRILFPLNWTERFPIFAKDLLRFKRLFKSNTHDDCADCLTGVFEKSGINVNASSALWD